MEFAKRGGTDSRYYSSAGEDDDRRPVKKEHMFNKVVTPSDVGKLNRLVIPKQLAEKYLPVVSSKNEKGLLLNFEDRNGKPWIFRYSYWNSSQTYVMTKGWIRFVKEKQLGAGDTVSFGRGVGEAAHDDYLLYIDWLNRRSETRTTTPIDVIPRCPLQTTYNNPTMSSVQPWNHLYTSPASAYDHDGHGPYGNGRYSFLYLTSSAGGSPTHSNLGHGVGDGFESSSTTVFESAAMRHSSVTLSSSSKKKNTKFVRLFGVNLDCSCSSSPALSLQLSLGDPGASTPDMV